jgi:uncharacterized damage-inducible protein DinB
VKFAFLALVPAAVFAQMPEVTGKPVDQATLRYIDIKTGEGAVAAPGKVYVVDYTGWLRDGTQFDSSIGKGPLSFVQGRRQVIPGFDAGFEGMKTGGKRRVFIPYQLAYGDRQRGAIPPKSDLIFDVELLEVKEPSPDGGAGAELLFGFNGAADHVVDLLKAFPEDKLDWRPGPGVRSVREVVMHIALGNRLLLNIADGASRDDLMKQIAENAKREREKLTKAQLLQILAESFQAARDTLKDTTSGSLSRDIDFFGTPTTRRGALTLLDTHLHEHFGQFIAYARMNGIVPPWSK